MKENDDSQIGRVLSRREAMALLGAAGGAMLTGSFAGGAQLALTPTGSPSCVVCPEQEVGPYYIDEQINRSDIRSDPTNGAVKAGAPLGLALMVYRVDSEGCRPIPGAIVDLWQCDASGAYSDVHDLRYNTLHQKFLRGFQLTDRTGAARFTTIYPGWYPTRTVHIHFKIRTSPGTAESREFTSQLYFSDTLTDLVYTSPPYAGRRPRPIRNVRDILFVESGRHLTLAPTAEADGYAATFGVGLAF